MHRLFLFSCYVLRNIFAAKCRSSSCLGILPDASQVCQPQGAFQAEPSEHRNLAVAGPQPFAESMAPPRHRRRHLHRSRLGCWTFSFDSLVKNNKKITTDYLNLMYIFSLI